MAGKTIGELEGTAALQGELWGARAAAWAELEERNTAVYEAVFDRLDVGSHTTLLDVGCGAGAALRVAADRGATVSGLDASEALLAIARDRLPEAELTVGDLQLLPYEDDSFDVVTGFNAFQFAAEPAAALREAGRVARPGAPVVIQVWGRPERCELMEAYRSIGPLLPPPAPGERDPHTSSAPGALARLAADAGLEPDGTGDVTTVFDFADEDELARLLLAPGMAVLAVRTSGEEAVRRAIVESLAGFRTPEGGYRLENEWHYLIARA
jgi:SAM-dependent methyltransferase